MPSDGAGFDLAFKTKAAFRRTDGRLKQFRAQHFHGGWRLDADANLPGVGSDIGNCDDNFVTNPERLAKSAHNYEHVHVLMSLPDSRAARV